MLTSLFRRFTAATVMSILGILLLAVAAMASPQTGTSYSFKTLNDNADPTFNQLLGINNHGVIAGYFGSGASGHPNSRGSSSATSRETEATNIFARYTNVAWWFRGPADYS